MVQNDYIPFSSEILEVIKHTDIEYTFRMAFRGAVKPGQFFEVSIPKYGEAPISVSGIGDGFVDLTIRRVGKVTNEVFEHYVGDTLLMRGPYGNGFDVENYKGKELVIIAGGTEVPPATMVKPMVDSLTPNDEAIPLAPSTNHCPPNTNPAKPPTMKRTDFQIGISLIFSPSASSPPLRAMAKV